MKRVFFSLAAVLIASAVAMAGDLARVPAHYQYGGQALQFFAPDGSKVDQTTVNSKTVDLGNYIMYSVWSASGTCYERLMPTSTKAGTATPISNTSWHTRAKNAATPFLNLSGCVGGFVRYQ